MKLHTENKQGSRWHVATGVQVGSDLDIYKYMVVYIVVIEVSAGVEGADWAVDSKQPNIKGNESCIYTKQ